MQSASPMSCLKITRLAAVSLLWMLTGLLSAQQGTWPQLQSDVAVDPAVTFGTLENGMRYAILPNAEPPGRV